MDWDNLVDVPLRKPLERLDPMAATASQLYPTAHGMTNRPNMCAKPVKHRNRIGRGSPTFEHTVLGAKESKCGEEIQHYRAKGYQVEPRVCKRRLDQKTDVVQGPNALQRQHLFDLSQSLTVPIRDAAYKPGQKPKNMRHPGLILPQQLGTSQSLMAFNASKVGTPARLREVAGWVPKQAPRFVTHDCTAMSPAVQANFRSTYSAIWGSTAKSNSEDYLSEYKRRFQSDLPGSPGNMRRINSRARTRFIQPDFPPVQIAAPVVPAVSPGL